MVCGFALLQELNKLGAPVDGLLKFHMNFSRRDVAERIIRRYGKHESEISDLEYVLIVKEMIEEID